MPSVTLNFSQSATQDQKVFAQAAAAVLNTIVNHPEFIRRVTEENYSGRKFRTDAPGVHYVEATNEQISQFIAGGKEFRTAPDNDIDLSVQLKRLRKKTVGAVTPPHPLITTNSRFFEQWRENNDPLSLAAHWLHEWMHVCGFRHAGKGKPDRQDVPYLVAKIAVEVGRLIQKQGGGVLAGVVDADLLGQNYLDAEADHLFDVESGDEAIGVHA
jgi:hypothetical protein